MATEEGEQLPQGCDFCQGWQPHSTGGNQQLIVLPPAPEALYCAA